MALTDNNESKVRISADEMEAFLLLPPPLPGEPYTKEEVMDFIRKSRVNHGVDEAAVERMIDGRIFGREVRIARGTKPIDGQDGFYQYNFNMDLNSKPEVREDGSVDYWSIHTIAMVEEGQVIATYTDPIDGVDGVAVTGRPVLAKRGRPQPPLSGKGFSRSADNHTYTADITGPLEMKNDRIQILSVYEVSGDVDVRTGNIDFRGDVIVHGNVSVGAVVKATGSITIDGLCQACTIEAGKDIVLRGGVLGAYKAVIRSKGNIHAKFFEYSTIEAEGFIEVESALSCNMVSYDRIYMEGKRASLVGGYAYGTSGIEVNTLGNVNEVKTQVHVGASTEVLKEIIDIQGRLADAKAMLNKITEGLTQLETIAHEKGINISTDERRIALLRTKMTKQAEIASDTKALDRLNDIVERGKGAFVRVIHEVYAGTTVTIDQTMLRVKDEQHSIDFVKRQGNVVMTALDDLL